MKAKETTYTQRVAARLLMLSLFNGREQRFVDEAWGDLLAVCDKDAKQAKTLCRATLNAELKELGK